MPSFFHRGEVCVCRWYRQALGPKTVCVFRTEWMRADHLKFTSCCAHMALNALIQAIRTKKLGCILLKRDLELDSEWVDLTQVAMA